MTNRKKYSVKLCVLCGESKGQLIINHKILFPWEERLNIEKQLS